MAANKRDKIALDETMKQLLDEVVINDVLDEEIQKLLKSPKQKRLGLTRFLRSKAYKGMLERAVRMNLTQSRLIYLSGVLKSEILRDLVSDGKMTLKEAISKTNYGPDFAKDKLFTALIDSISDTIEYLIKQNSIRNPELGLNFKKEADAFAVEIGEGLEQVRAEGFTSTRKIAQRFNELGIKSARGGQWSHVTVNRLINRRKELGLEDPEPHAE